jgi:hypothetical protein
VLGTVRPQPLSLGGNGAIEAIFYQGQPQAFLTPTTLASVLAAPSNGLGTTNLLAIRDQTLDSLNAYARGMGNTAQKNFITSTRPRSPSSARSSRVSSGA